MKRELTVFAALTALWCFTMERAPAATLTNWARVGVATQSTTYGTAAASRAIDGNTAGGWGDASTTHTADSENDPGANPWWQVDLQETRPIGHVHFWFREDCCFDRNDYLRFVIYDSTNTATRVVLWETNNTAWLGAVPRDIGFNVSPPVDGRVLYVEHMPEQAAQRYVCLTEAEVFDQNLVSGANYALQGSASSSSCYSGDCTLYGAQQAIDGGHMGLSAVSPWGYSAPDNATPESDPMPWWQLDLASAQTVGSVVIWPRRDRTYARFEDLKLSVLDGGSAKLYEQVFTVQPSGPRFVVNFVPPLAGAKVVRIETTAETPDKFLNLPEVEVFAPQVGTPALTFTTDLQAVTVEQNRAASFGPVAVSVDGGIRPEDISYRWYKNGAEIPNMAGSWLAAYTTPGLVGLANSGEKYKVQASVSGYGVFSSEVTLNVVADTTAPVLTNNNFEVSDLVRMNLVFNEMLDAETATNKANYVLAGGPTVGGITLSADARTVTFAIQGLLLGDMVDVTVSGVKDLAGNTMTPAHIVAASPQAPLNYALTGVARQDSDYGASVASRAIDGNTAGSWGAATIACTGGSLPGWWEVDMKEARTIGIVKIHWRTDCCPRNANIDLVVYDKADEATRVEVRRISISGPEGLGSAPFTLELAQPITGQVLRLEHRPDTDNSTDSGAWQLCTAEVMIMPPPTGLQITSAPRSWSVYEGDRVLLKTSVTGTQPIVYKWQLDGLDVPGATDLNLTIPAIAAGQAGSYTLVASNALRVRTSPVAAVAVAPRPSLANSLVALYAFEADTGTNVVDSAPMNPAKSTMHDGRNTGALWNAAVDGRNGVMQFDGVLSPYSLIEAISHPDFDGPDTNQPNTITFWMKAGPTDGNPGNTGSTLFDRQSGAQGYGGYTIQLADVTGGGTNYIQHSLTGGYAAGNHNVGDDVWHHVTLIYGHVPYSIGTVYVDGQLDSDAVYDLTGSWPTFRNLMFGTSWDGWWQHFNGYLDDIHIFNRILNPGEITQVMAGLSFPPELSYSLKGTELTITWSAAGFILQQNTELANATGWADIANATGGSYTTTKPATGNNYYRLKKQ